MLAATGLSQHAARVSSETSLGYFMHIPEVHVLGNTLDKWINGNGCLSHLMLCPVNEQI